MKKTFREYHTLNILNSFDFQGKPLDVHLSQYFRANKALGSKDRKAAADAVYSLVRWLGLVDHFCEGNHDWETRREVHRQLDLKKNLVNPEIPLHIRASFPKELFQLLADHMGEKAALEFCLESNKTAPTTLRVNVLKSTRQKLLARWRGIYDTTPTTESVFGIHFHDRVHFQSLAEFRDGFFEVQDEASQLVAGLVDACPGQKVLDFCSGSGGKTLGFAHKLQGTGQIYLHDIRKGALERAKRRLRRAGIENAQILASNSPQKESLKGKMDWVLVDAPCTGTGTLRRNPDMKWKFSKEMLERLVIEQKEIFEEALQYLSPEGTIVYSTCSVLPQENEEQIAYFQKKHGLFLSSRPFQTFPKEGGMDGFFGAVLKPPPQV